MRRGSKKEPVPESVGLVGRAPPIDTRDHNRASATVVFMEEAVPARMQEGVARIYRTERVEVTWAPGRCIHAGECFGNLPEVFDPRARPWIRVEAADPDLIENTVLLCPSGALGFRRLDD
jgi:uncharacterized Fe-S cluster protein YjdI